MTKDPSFLHADSEDSDQTEWMPKANLSLRWADMLFCGFCHEAAQMCSSLSVVYAITKFLLFILSLFQTNSSSRIRISDLNS